MIETRRNSRGDLLGPSNYTGRSYDDVQVGGVEKIPSTVRDDAEPRSLGTGEQQPLFEVEDETPAPFDVGEHEPLVSLCVDREGFAVTHVDGRYLLDDATWGDPEHASWMATREIAVYSCYVRAARRARWWYPGAFVVPCR